MATLTARPRLAYLVRRDSIGTLCIALMVVALSGCVAVRVVKVEVYAPDRIDIAPVLRDINAEVGP